MPRMGVLRHLRPLGPLLALLLGSLFASGCGVETCDDSTFRGRCDGRTAVSCPHDSLLPFSFVDRRACDGACAADGNIADCVDDPPTPCTESRCDGNRAIWCMELGSASYEVTTVCGAGEACEDGSCVAQ